MASSPAEEGELGFVTRRQISALFQIPQRIVNQWIATGRITGVRTPGLGRGGQRVFYSAAEVKKLTVYKPKRKRKGRSRKGTSAPDQ
ncbi:MAG: hypothetical protein IT331_00870 [Anaerolineae bacterium]|nr:hypothetical protein [Anaerolineae bacterium]